MEKLGYQVNVKRARHMSFCFKTFYFSFILFAASAAGFFCKSDCLADLPHGSRTISFSEFEKAVGGISDKMLQANYKSKPSSSEKNSEPSSFGVSGVQFLKESITVNNEAFMLWLKF